MRQRAKRNGKTAVWLLATVSFFLFYAAVSFASDFSMRVWQSDAGLPDNRVTGIIQGSEGYLWVSTYDGLCRFDGVRFQQVELPEIPGTPHHLIRAMLLGRDQSIWLALDGGVAMQIPHGGHRIQVITEGLPDVAALSIAQDDTGAVWISYTDGTARRIEGKKAMRFAGTEGLRGPQPCWLASGPSSQIWFAKAGRVGVFRNNFFVALQSLKEQSLRLCAGRKDGVWLRVGRELVRFKEGGEPQIVGRLPMEAKSADPSVLFEDRDGAVWVGSASSGLFRFADGAVARVETSHPEIRSISQDHEGTLWIGTGGGGLNRLRPSVLELHSRESGLPFEVVQSICEDTSGTLWVALQNGTLASRRGDGWVSVLPTADWPANDASCLVAEPKGGVWIGTRTHGVYHLNEGRYLHWDRSRGLGSDYVRSLLIDTSGNLWVGQHWSNCVQRLSGGQIHTIPLPPESEAIRALTEDASAAVWAGDSAGNLYRIKQDVVSDETRRTLSGRRPIRTLQSTPDGSVWIGYALGGLGWIRSNAFVHISPQAGLSQQDVSQIVPDAEGNLWLGGNKGVSRVRREDLDAFADARVERLRVFDYGSDEGFPNLQANYGFMPGGLCTRDGRVWLPMRTGLLEVNTEQVFPNLLWPPVLIERVLLDGQPLQFSSDRSSGKNGGRFFGVPLPSHAVHVPPRHRKLDLEFTALSFIAPESIRFRCRLEGLDEEWIDIQHDRKISYLRLPAGDYRFRVSACNNSGVWNEVGAALHFKVSPFFWQTWWFRAATFACFTIAMVAVVRYVSFRRLCNQVQRLEQESVLHTERARIARDLHDDLGANLTQIAMLSELVRHDLSHPEQTESQLDKVANRAREVIKTLDEIVWAVNPRNDTLSHLLEYIGQFAVDFLSAAEIRCRVDFPDHPADRVLAGEDRHNLYLVVKEALNNVVKHAQASEVWLRATVTDEALVLSVEDNGRGLDHAVKDAWADGLRNMRQRLAAVGGTLELTSETGEGAVVRIRFPWPRD